LLGEDNISNSKINIKLEYLFIIEIFLAILNFISIGILYPFFLYLRYALVYSKTQIDGYKLVFKGNIFVFYFHYLWWYFLTIITLGIYHFFLEYKLYKWVVKNIYFDNNKKAIKLEKDDYEKYDYIIGMSDSNIRDIEKILNKKDIKKIKRLLDFSSNHRDIADPWYTNDFEKAYNDILEGCTFFLDFCNENNIL